MRNAAGKLANHLQLLCMPKHFLRPAALGDFNFQLTVGLGQLPGALSDRILQRLVRAAQGLFRAPHPQQGRHGRQQFLGLNRLHQKAVGATFQCQRAVERAGDGRGSLQHCDAGDNSLDLAANFNAMNVRQPHVKQYQAR